MRATREQILHVAASTFAEKGYHGATLATVGQQLGLSKSAVLYHFASKDQLLEEMLEPVVAGMTALLDDRERHPPTDLAGRLALVKELMGFYALHRAACIALQTDTTLWFRGRVGARMSVNYDRIIELLSGPGGDEEAVARAHTTATIAFRAMTVGLDSRRAIVSVDDPAGVMVLRICADILRG